MKNITIDIDYDDSDQSSYNGIIASYGDITEKFNTNDPTVDYIDCLKWCSNHDYVFLLFSSGVDHFIFDGDQYKFVYIDHQNNNQYIEDFSNMSISDIDKFAKYIVHKDINSYEEHFTYYKSKK